ncbi:hypothetical protein HZC53_04070 [Candidatus Uhrbacteria bacterium]|nr:hypothetical protein [Candidatus Uhrbacteria bacterium]
MPDENSIGGLTAGELQVATWWVRNGAAVRKAGYTALIALCAILWGYTLWGLLDAYAISYPRESRLTRDIALNQQYLAALESDRPQSVAISEVSVYQSTDNRLDMGVTITNPNPQWWAEFNYRFNVSGEDTPLRSGYVLPQGEQQVLELGYKAETKGARSASFAVENVRWHRVDPYFVSGSYPDFKAKRFNLQFLDVTYDSNLTVGNKKVGQTSFTLVNDSAFGYWGVDLVIRLERAGNTIAIQQVKVTNLQPGEKRLMQIVWPDNPAGTTQTEITPQVNLLDAGSYLTTQYFK